MTALDHGNTTGDVEAASLATSRRYLATAMCADQIDRSCSP
jgi:hypothetical protein